MAETRRNFDQDFREGAVRIVQETGKSIAQVARDLGINSGTLSNWVSMAGESSGTSAGGGRADVVDLRRKWPTVVVGAAIVPSLIRDMRHAHSHRGPLGTRDKHVVCCRYSSPPSGRARTAGLIYPAPAPAPTGPGSDSADSTPNPAPRQNGETRPTRTRTPQRVEETAEGPRPPHRKTTQPDTNQIQRP